MLCTFWLGNALCATMAYTFSTSQLPQVVQSWRVLTPKTKLLRNWGALYILTWKCASRHSGVHFFISHLARWLRTRRFSEPTFRPSGATNHWKKHSESWLSYLFAHLHLLASHSFSSLIFSLLFFFSLILSTSAFPCLHIVGSLTSKLPSIIVYIFVRTLQAQEPEESWKHLHLSTTQDFLNQFWIPWVFEPCEPAVCSVVAQCLEVPPETNRSEPQTVGHWVTFYLFYSCRYMMVTWCTM